MKGFTYFLVIRMGCSVQAWCMSWLCTRCFTCQVAVCLFLLHVTQETSSYSSLTFANNNTYIIYMCAIWYYLECTYLLFFCNTQLCLTHLIFVVYHVWCVVIVLMFVMNKTIFIAFLLYDWLFKLFTYVSLYV